MKSILKKECQLFIGTVVMGRFIIDDFQIVMQGGRGDEIEYMVKFIEYKEVSIRVLREGVITPIRNFRSSFLDDGVTPSTYVIQEGDTWAIIAQKTGIPAFRLQRHNNILNHFNLLPGQVLDLRVPLPDARYYDDIQVRPRTDEERQAAGVVA